MRLINFGTLAAVAVTAMALGQTSQRNGPGVPMKRGSKVGNRVRGWKKIPGKNAKRSKKVQRKPGITNSHKNNLIFTSGENWRPLPEKTYKNEGNADLMGKVKLPSDFQIEWEINSFKLSTWPNTFPLFIGNYDFNHGFKEKRFCPDGDTHSPDCYLGYNEYDDILVHIFLEYNWNPVIPNLFYGSDLVLPRPTVPRHKIILRSTNFQFHQTLLIKRDVYNYGETKHNGEADCRRSDFRWFWTDETMECTALVSDLIEVKAHYYVKRKDPLSTAPLMSTPVYSAYINELMEVGEFEEWSEKKGKSSRVKIYKLD